MNELLQSEKIFIYGSGTFAIFVAQEVENRGFEVAGFIDHRNVGEVLFIHDRAYEIKSISGSMVSKNDVCLLAVCNLHGNLFDISRELLSRESGLRLLTPVQFYLEFSIAQDNYWLTSDLSIYQSESEDIEEFLHLLSTEESQDLYRQTIQYRQEGTLESLPMPRPLQEQYLALDLGTPPRELSVVDAGACQGENLDSFIKAGLSLKSYFAFEPDVVNLQTLSRRSDSLGLKNFLHLPLALWSSTTILSFSDSGDASSSINSDAEHKIQAIDLDTFLGSGTYVNFIKMDIEGAEYEALLGARMTISKMLPNLAISAYHKPSDLWRLGLLINNIAPNKYEFHMRNYGHQTFDTVLYAIPKSY